MLASRSSLPDTAATSQDGSSLEFNKAIAGRQCYIQDASSRGLCLQYTNNLAIVSGPSVAVVDCVLPVVAQVLQTHINIFIPIEPAHRLLQSKITVTNPRGG